MRTSSRGLHRSLRLLVASIAMSSMAVLPANASYTPVSMEEPHSWQSVLAVQLLDRYNCQFDAVVFVREFKLAGKLAMEGRARCVDHREVEFSRNSLHAMFKLRLCEPVIC